MCEADCQALLCSNPSDPALDSLSFYAYVQSRNVSPTAIATASVWTRAMLGQASMSRRCTSSTTAAPATGLSRCAATDGTARSTSASASEGTQSFANTMAADLPADTVQFGERVDAILQSPGAGSIVISRTGRAIRAKKVPALPPKKQLLVDSFRYVYYAKVMLVFRSAWWVERGYCGLVQSFKGPASIYWDTSSPRDGKYGLTAFLAGDSGRQWAQEKNVRKREQADEELLGWGFSCPALPPGVLTLAGDALRESVGNIHFVGTETAAEWKGYMEGAVRSGRRGAREVVQGLNRNRRL
ncbi:flavin monoamine oxidase family protein [Aspergillus homomorphus CBS 101889]|uniref:monoamine oxidase n=1 Tax=Aspergillus homomorphus (strain CBS 101889) TaxID=1450537 RepID=A0A395HTW5_ASPHC|nr:hypothetical protein BO97DRAFT_435561 [Aspergillus homomorphus CBS 101889]RAL10949.1 hypothetical protein BO97DRAFT_435561 [Aspergillus homomorphus CBS 101889]